MGSVVFFGATATLQQRLSVNTWPFCCFYAGSVNAATVKQAQALIFSAGTSVFLLFYHCIFDYPSSRLTIPTCSRLPLSTAHM